ncbi:MAG: hypothetical protein ABIN91_21050 [Mucilaginibacter sp.]|uniref:hypothetical protein n=1 Tax=Mucilaginibacter sp. TaxID=1882438 RepID=UPI0032676E23
MRTSLNEIKAIEDHLFNRNHPADSLLFQANLILNIPLRDKVALQNSTYQIVEQYGRKQLKAEIEAVHQKLLNKPNSFMQRLISLFKK